MRIARGLTTKIIKYNEKRIVCFCLIGALVLTALGVCIFFHRHYIEIPVLEYKSMRPTKNHVIVHASCPKDWVWIDTGNGEKILNSFTQNANENGANDEEYYLGIFEVFLDDGSVYEKLIHSNMFGLFPDSLKNGKCPAAKECSYVELRYPQKEIDNGFLAEKYYMRLYQIQFNGVVIMANFCIYENSPYSEKAIDAFIESLSIKAFN